MAKYLCIHEVYERYDNGGTRTSRFEADSDVAALIKVMDNCMYGYEDANDASLGDDGFIMPKLEDCIDRIESSNGDGCDYILRVENVDTGEVVFEAEDYTIEDVEW